MVAAILKGDSDMFITLEGGEGTGKSTQTKRLAERLKQLGYSVVQTREPGGSPLAQRAREALLSGSLKAAGAEVEALVLALARSDHLHRVIRPALASGAFVVCDRFVDSTRALQGASGLNDETIEALVQEAAGDNMPDVTFVLMLDDVQIASRRQGRGISDRFEDENLDFHNEVNRRFAALAAQGGRYIAVDAAGDEEIVADRIWTELNRRLPRPLQEAV